MNDVLGYDCDGEEIEEYRILRFPFSVEIENWEEEPNVEPRFYCPIRTNDGKCYLISVYDDWFCGDVIRKYENLGKTERIPTKIKSIEEARNYEVAFNGITKREWYYDRDRKVLKKELQTLLKNIKSINLWEEREKLEQILTLDKIAENEEQIVFDIIPELKAEKDFQQNNSWHIYDVWNHTKKVFENSKPDKEIRLALLLHDIGKPRSYQEDEKGIRHFRGHSQKSAEISEQILRRLGYNENEISSLCFLIGNHDKIIQPEEINTSNLEMYKKLLYIQYCDASGYNPEYIQRVYDRLDKISLYLKEYEEKMINRKIDNEERES